MPTPSAGTILLVDDGDGVRVTLRRQLTVHGHTVLEASDGAEALELIRVRRGNVDVVLSDVVMPEMNGTELAGAIHREFPGLPVILMSAYSRQVSPRSGRTTTPFQSSRSRSRRDRSRS